MQFMKLLKIKNGMIVVLPSTQKKSTEDTISIEKTNGQAAAASPFRAAMKLFLSRVRRKEGVSASPENSARSQGARRKMADFSARNFISQVFT